MRNNELKNIITNSIKKRAIKLLIIGLSYKDSSLSLVNSIFQKIFKTKKIRTSYYDSYFKENIRSNFKLKRTKNLIKGLNQADIVILNYCSDNDFLTIKNKFSKSNLKKYLVNISIKYQNFFKKNRNVIKFYSSSRIKHD